MSNPSGLEIERKFLLSQAPDLTALRAHDAQPQELTQYYLAGAADAPLRRLRVLKTGTVTTYLYTEKRGLGGITREECEHEPSPREAIGLLAQADPHFAPITKTRWTWTENGQTWELDIFDSPVGLVLLEAELDDAAQIVTPPAWLGSTRDVSEDPAYQNASLARALASRPKAD